MDNKNYTFFVNPGDLEKLRSIGLKEERAVSWMLRKLYVLAYIIGTRSRNGRTLKINCVGS